MSEHRIGYKRVSTTDQNMERQLDGIELDKIFEDKVSGSTKDREGLNALLSHIRAGDYVYCHDISRMARNTGHLLELVKEITGKGATLKFVSEGLTFSGDKSNPMEELMLVMLGAVYDFERKMTAERVREGVNKARLAGKYKGRKPSINRDLIKSLLNEGLSLSRTAKAAGVCVSSVQKVRREMKKTS